MNIAVAGKTEDFIILVTALLYLGFYPSPLGRRTSSKRSVVYIRFGSAAGNHTAYVYIEDDTEVLWPALLSWAIDTEALEPLNFQRGFYRTEVGDDGESKMLDQNDPPDRIDVRPGSPLPGVNKFIDL